LHVRALALLAAALYAGNSVGDQKGEIAFLRRAQRHHPGHFSLNYSLAYSLLSRTANSRQGSWAEVTGFYRAALAVRPRSTNALYGLGLSLARQGKLDDAILAFREVLSLKPDHSPACRSLILTLEKKGDLEGALAARRRWRNFARARDWYILGVVHYRAGHWKDAVAALEQSMALGRKGPIDRWFFLAMAHWRLGEKEKARAWYDQAVRWMDKNQPNNEELRRLRAEAANLLGSKEKKK
jgi:tetratricopeptide (TPR) repeat protein